MTDIDSTWHSKSHLDSSDVDLDADPVILVERGDEVVPYKVMVYMEVRSRLKHNSLAQVVNEVLDSRLDEFEVRPETIDVRVGERKEQPFKVDW